VRDTQPTHGLSTKQVPVSAHVGSSKKLKDLKDPRRFPFFVAGRQALRTPGYDSSRKRTPRLLAQGKRRRRWEERGWQFRYSVTPEALDRVPQNLNSAPFTHPNPES